jgi:hypothetical protein
MEPSLGSTVWPRLEHAAPEGVIGAIWHGSPSAVLRRSEGTCLSSRSDDEVGGFERAIRSERSEPWDRVR